MGCTAALSDGDLGGESEGFREFFFSFYFVGTNWCTGFLIIQALERELHNRRADVLLSAREASVAILYQRQQHCQRTIVLRTPTIYLRRHSK